MTGAPNCPANTCPPGEQIYRLYRVFPPPVTPLSLQCVGAGQAPPPVAAALPQVTAAMVLREFRRIPLPAPRSVTQPAGRTLINFETIFFTHTEHLTRTLTLLGQQVRLEIQPTSYRWAFGDGTSAATDTAGAAYPRKDITHRYANAHTVATHRVSVTWSARYSVNGGPLQDVGGTVTTNGPPTPIAIAEASPALSGAGQ